MKVDVEEINIKEKNMSKKKHNGIISFWKFMFSMMIVVYHFFTTVKLKYFARGDLGVEFFFIVSGYLMAKNANKIENIENKDVGKTTWSYIWKKIKAMFPYILPAYIISIFVKSSFRTFKLYQYIRSIWNILLLDMSGIVTTYMLGQTWYISAMLISMLILYPLILKYKKNFTYLIAPIIVLFVGGYISHTYGNLAGVWTWSGVIYKGLLRALFEITIGVIAYEVSGKIQKLNFTKIGSVILNLIEIIGFIAVFIIGYSQSKNYDFIAVGFMTISIIIAFSEKTVLFKYANNKIFYYLEKLSLPIYLNHIWIKDLIVKFTDWIIPVKLMACIIFTIIISWLTILLVEKTREKMVKIIRGIFLENK